MGVLDPGFSTNSISTGLVEKLNLVVIRKDVPPGGSLW